MATTLFKNNTGAGVTSGGTDAPVSGTIETWTMNNVVGFPTSMASGASQFHIADIANDSEKILVTAISGNTWTVTRGDEGTTPTTHIAGFLVEQVVTGGEFTDGMTVWYNVVAFGADPTGSSDSTTAFQNAINTSTGSANPAVTGRYAYGPVYIPPGIYKITSDIIIRSVLGFHLIGAGADQVRIMPSGTGFTQACIFIDGSLDGVYEGFVIQGDTTEQVTDAIRLDWTTAASRSTSGNCFRDVRIRNTNFVVGISLEGNGSRQLDGTTFENVVVTGSQIPGSWSNTGNWQKGLAFGNGTFGNNYDHRGLGVDAAQCYYGYYINASSFALFGAQPGANCYDFYIIPGAQCTIENLQSQSCYQFLTQGSTFGPACVSFKDIEVTTYYLNGSNVIANIYGGIWSFTNFVCSAVQNSSIGSYQQGVFNIAGAASSRPAVVTFDNLCSYGLRTSTINATTTNPIVVNNRNYVNYNPNTGNYVAPAAGDMQSVFYGGSSASWVNLDSFLSSPALTGTPTAPTQSAGDNSTKIATDAFVATAVNAISTEVSEVQASDLSVTAWTVNPMFANTVYAYPAATYYGRLLLFTFRAPVNGTINTINYPVDAVGSGLSNCYLGIYSMGGSLLGSCPTNQSTNFASTGMQAATLSSALATTQSTLYRVGIVLGGAGTFPTFVTAGNAISATYSNAGLAASYFMSAFYGAAGTYTTLPTSYIPANCGGLVQMPVFVMD